jgi:hypothetical protein
METSEEFRDIARKQDIFTTPEERDFINRLEEMKDVG